MKASKLLARAGMLIVLTSVGYTWFLLATRTTTLIGLQSLLMAGPCYGSPQPYQPDMILGDSQVLTLTADYNERWTEWEDKFTTPCRFQAELSASDFEISPQAEQEVDLPPGEKASLFWTITPTSVGAHTVEISNYGDRYTLYITVVDRSVLYNLTGLTQQQIINGIAYFLGLALTLPWVTIAWHRHENVLSALSPQRDLFNISILFFAGAVACFFFGGRYSGVRFWLIQFFLLALVTLFISWLVGRAAKGN